MDHETYHNALRSHVHVKVAYSRLRQAVVNFGRNSAEAEAANSELAAAEQVEMDDYNALGVQMNAAEWAAFMLDKAA